MTVVNILEGDVQRARGFTDEELEAFALKIVDGLESFTEDETYEEDNDTVWDGTLTFKDGNVFKIECSFWEFPAAAEYFSVADKPRQDLVEWFRDLLMYATRDAGIAEDDPDLEYINRSNEIETTLLRVLTYISN